MTTHHINYSNTANNLTNWGDFSLRFMRRIARRFALLTVRCISWSVAMQFRFWDGTDPATRGDNRARQAPGRTRAAARGGLA